VYVALAGCCLVPLYLWFGQSSKQVDVAVALGSLGASNAPLSSSAASNRARPANGTSANTRASRTPTAKHSATSTTPSRSDIAAPHGFDPSAAARESREPMNRAELLVDEGALLFEDGRLGLAEASYLKALNVMPSYPRAMAGLVRVHIERKDGAEAVRWAKQLVVKQPKNGQHQLLLGDAQALRGDSAAAREAWNQAVRYGNYTARQRLSASY
jgi:tetratricopeptide (TPR) repeat protein